VVTAASYVSAPSALKLAEARICCNANVRFWQILLQKSAIKSKASGGFSWNHPEGEIIVFAQPPSLEVPIISI
jgi:hypothetical protein